jgi:hypothetical protein
MSFSSLFLITFSTLLARAPQPTLTVDVRCGDAKSPSDLGDFAAPNETLQLMNNTPAVCVTECTDRGYSLAALQRGNLCTCGNTYIDDIQPIRMGSWNCDYSCAGDSSQNCGGYTMRIIYRTSLYPSVYCSCHAVTHPHRVPISSSSSSSSLPATSTSTTSVPQPSLTVDIACGIDNYRGNGGFGFYDSYRGLLEDNTPAVCIDTCVSQGFSLAAVENGYVCNCGNSYVDGVPPASAPASECNTPCEDDSTLSCGGDYRVTVYRTSLYN